MGRFGEAVDPRLRAERLDEGLEVLAALVSGKRVRHFGAHYTVDDVRMLPTPNSGSKIPTWIAGRWPNRAPMRRAVRHDGMFVINVKTENDVHDLLGSLRELRGDLSGYDVVLQPPNDALAASWSAIPDVSWLLTQFGPYDLNLADIYRRVRQGPATA